MPQYGEYYVLEDIFVPMRDGVKLATDVYMPARDGQALEGPWPTILIRTPYDKGGLYNQKLARRFAYHGYATVIQDCRGRYGSEGVFYPFANEPKDGHDCIVWVGEQPWCDGRVGTMGTSYLAQTQVSLAVTDPPHLASQFVSQGTAHYHQTRSRRGGTFESHRVNWILKMAMSSPAARENPVIERALRQMKENLIQWLRDGFPIRPGQTPLAQTPEYERALLDFMTRGDFDEYWHTPGLSLELYYDDYKDVPVTWLGSWYDGYPMETTQDFMAVSARSSSPQRLILGPWIHGMEMEEATFAGDVDLGPSASLEVFEERLRWFDYTLKGLDNGLSGEAPVRLFIMGGGSGERLPSGKMDHGGAWREEREWPLARTRYTPFYLRQEGGLEPEPPAQKTSSTTYTYDPADPVPSMGLPGRSLFERGGGGFDQVQDLSIESCTSSLPLSSRRDVLVFQTPPLKEDTEITGPIEVVLYVASTAVDTDFTAKLIDQYPPTDSYPHGYALELTYSIRRCRYRDGFEAQEMMEPGQVYQLRFPLPPTGNLFKKGHRIRLDVSSSNWPKYEANPNTGESLGRERRRETAQNTVFHDAGRPSHVVLPLIPPAER